VMTISTSMYATMALCIHFPIVVYNDKDDVDGDAEGGHELYVGEEDSV
jgi:hypothetical protein